jgi:hypothetical protein
MPEEPTQHHWLRKEYMLGMQTGDVVCTRCGDSWEPKDPDRHGPCPAT